MLAIFCLRLCTGILAALLLLSPAQVNPRFYRTHFLTAFGLTAVSTAFLRESADIWLWITLGSLLFFSAIGSMSWMLEGAPLGKALIWVALPLALASLAQSSYLVPLADTGDLRSSNQYFVGFAWLLVDDLTSAALLGSALTAMLIGHSYLIAPAMSLTPLYTLLGALAGSTVLRIGIAGAGLWWWTSGDIGSRLDNEMLLWLGVRWGVGFLGILVLCWLAWETTRIRSTQSATGILYVVVIFCFLGELTSLLLLARTGFVI